MTGNKWPCSIEGLVQRIQDLVGCKLDILILKRIGNGGFVKSLSNATVRRIHEWLHSPAGAHYKHLWRDRTWKSTRRPSPSRKFEVIPEAWHTAALDGAWPKSTELPERKDASRPDEDVLEEVD